MTQDAKNTFLTEIPEKAISGWRSTSCYNFVAHAKNGILQNLKKETYLKF